MKYVLLTGASGGLGKFLANKLLEQGYFVILHYFKNKEVVDEIHQKYPDKSLVIQANLKEEQEINNMKNTLDSKKIKIDILINNAAIDHVSELDSKDAHSFLEILKLNTVAPFLLMKIFGMEMEKRKGSIVNISSDNAIDMEDIVTLEYDVSKVGLNELTKIFAKYYQNVTVNAICFGWLDTKMNDFPEDYKKEINFVPLEVASKKIMELMNEKETGKIEIVR